MKPASPLPTWITSSFTDKPLQKFERLLETYLDYAPAGIRSFLQAMPLWLKEKLWIREQIAREAGFAGTVLFTEHHESHAASAFFPSPFESAAILTIDGVGEWATGSFGAGKGNRIDLLAETRFPHSLGLLYSAFTYYLGFKVNSGEYKVMALAPYGEPKYTQKILDEVVDLRPDGSMRLNMELFNYCQGLTMTNSAFDRIFGGPQRQARVRNRPTWNGPRAFDTGSHRDGDAANGKPCPQSDEREESRAGGRGGAELRRQRTPAA